MLASRSDDVQVTFRIGSTADEEEENSFVAHGIRDRQYMFELLSLSRVSSVSGKLHLCFYTLQVLLLSLFLPNGLVTYLVMSIFVVATMDKCSQAFKRNIWGDSSNCSQ